MHFFSFQNAHLYRCIACQFSAGICNFEIVDKKFEYPVSKKESSWGKGLAFFIYVRSSVRSGRQMSLLLSFIDGKTHLLPQK